MLGHVLSPWLISLVEATLCERSHSPPLFALGYSLAVSSSFRWVSWTACSSVFRMVFATTFVLLRSFSGGGGPRAHGVGSLLCLLTLREISLPLFLLFVLSHLKFCSSCTREPSTSGVRGRCLAFGSVLWTLSTLCLA